LTGMDARGIGKHDLVIVTGENAVDTMTRGLGLARSDADLLPQQMIHQSGFAYVRATNNRHQTAAGTVLIRHVVAPARSWLLVRRPAPPCGDSGRWRETPAPAAAGDIEHQTVAWVPDHARPPPRIPARVADAPAAIPARQSWDPSRLSPVTPAADVAQTRPAPVAHTPADRHQDR